VKRSVLLFVSVAVHLGGVPSATPNQPLQLIGASDVIVVASLGESAVEPNGHRLTLDVRRVHKGKASTKILKPLWAGDPKTQVVGKGEHYGLWFLKGSPDAREAGRDLLVNPIDTRFNVSGDLLLPLDPSVSPPDGAIDRGADTLDRLVEELRTVIHRSRAALIGPAVGMARLMVLTLRPAHHPLPAGVTTHDCPTRRLIQEFDVLVALRLEAELKAGRGAALPGEVVSALCSMTDPRAALVATRLVERRDDGPDGTVLADNSRAIRYCASMLLRSVHPPESLPQLAAMLDTGDRKTQYLGLRGLAEFASDSLGEGAATGPSPAQTHVWSMSPAYSTFLADPERYLTFWRRWAADRRSPQPAPQ
jgi:hypothetical protein